MQYVNIHTHSSTSQPDVFEVVNQYPDAIDENLKHYSIGIHPWHIDENRLEHDLAVIAQKATQTACVAIGECGLDKRIETRFDLQRRVFESQLHIAKEKHKPVIVHCVAAFQELSETKKRLDFKLPIAVHGFSKNTQLARQLLQDGFQLSFGKWLLRNPELEIVFTSVPDDRFFLETDTETDIKQVYALAARYRKIELSELSEMINKNFKNFINPV